MIEKIYKFPSVKFFYKLIFTKSFVKRDFNNISSKSQIPPKRDLLTMHSIPSVKILGSHNRVLANIDQDGFKFAVHPLDEMLFNRRNKFIPRKRYHLDIILLNKGVYIRKHFKNSTNKLNLRQRLYSFSGLNFYTELVALKKLEKLKFIPKIYQFSIKDKVLIMDYIHGDTLQYYLAQHVDKLLDSDYNNSREMDHPNREKREISAFAQYGKPYFKIEIDRKIKKIFNCGVCPLDIKTGNIIIGHQTGKLYWIDFERSSIDNFPFFNEDIIASKNLITKWFFNDNDGEGPGS